MAYVYYSYEEFGRGYIGSRARSPVGDDNYLGSFKDKTFNPTQKIILAEFETMAEAMEIEGRLQRFFDVVPNPHFANKAEVTSTGFTRAGYKIPEEELVNYRNAWDGGRREKMGVWLTELNQSEEFRKKHYAQNMRNRRAHWTREVWDAVAEALEKANGKFHWGSAEILQKFDVSGKTLQHMKKLILEGATFEEATYA